MRLNVPTTWDDISIDQFAKLSRINRDELDNIDYMLQLVAICCKVPYSDVCKFGIEDLKAVVEKLSFVDTMPVMRKIDPIIKYDREYVCVLDIQKITAGQYIDLKSYVKSGAIENIHNILTVFYIPKGEKYAKTPIEETAKIFLERMSIAQAYPIAVFFWNLVKDSTAIIQDSLLSESMNQIQKILDLELDKTDSLSIGVG